MKNFPKWAALFLLGLSAVSCKEEEINSAAQDYISFYLSEPLLTKAADTLSGRVSSARLNQPLVSNRGDTLYLHSSCAESASLLSDGRRSTMEAKSSTKARPMDMTALEKLGQFPVWAWRQGAAQAYIDGEWIYCQAAGWNFADEHYWPTDGSLLDFYAIAPVMTADGADLLDAGPLFAFEENKMFFSYEVPVAPPSRSGHDAEYQPDLLASIHPGLRMDSDDGKVSLSFKHLLSSVRFVLSDVPAGYVESVTLRNVVKSGRCQVGVTEGMSDQAEVQWTPGTEAADYVQNIGVAVYESSGAEVQALDADDLSTTFQLIPQKFKAASPARLELRFRFEGETEARVYSLDLLGEWKPGFTYTYRISTGLLQWHYRINQLSDQESDYDVETFKRYIYAYKETDGGLLDTAHWKVSYSLDEGLNWISQEETPLSWLRATPASGFSGKNTSSVIEFWHDATEFQYTQTDMRPVHKANLQAAESRGTENLPFDLSLHDVYGRANPSGRTVANCYVVSAPGWYRIPLAYGNALVDGEVNVSAYEAQVAGEYVVPVLPNAYDAGITAPWLEDDLQACGKTLDNDGAVLLWMDKPSLLSVNPALVRDEDGKRCLVFHLAPAHIDQGNAVVAVRDSDGEVVWSWHIWVVDPTSLFTYRMWSNKQYYQLLSMALGWEEWQIDRYDYQERSCLIKVSAGDAECQFRLHQSAGLEEAELGALTFYQWGRKDPLLPASNLSDFEFLELYGDRPGRYSDGENAVRVAESIRNPEVFYRITSGPRNWCTDNDAYFYNMWDNGNNKIGDAERIPVKTVYDPCPPGFRMPSSNVFSLMLTSFVVGNFHKGNRYYCDGWKNSTFFVPCPGFIYNYVSLKVFPSYGTYWSFAPYGNNSSYVYRNNSYAHGKSFHHTAVIEGGIERSGGALIRPVAMED